MRETPKAEGVNDGGSRIRELEHEEKKQRKVRRNAPLRKCTFYHNFGRYGYTIVYKLKHYKYIYNDVHENKFAIEQRLLLNNCKSLLIIKQFRFSHTYILFLSFLCKVGRIRRITPE